MDSAIENEIPESAILPRWILSSATASKNKETATSRKNMYGTSAEDVPLYPICRLYSANAVKEKTAAVFPQSRRDKFQTKKREPIPQAKLSKRPAHSTLRTTNHDSPISQK